MNSVILRVANIGIFKMLVYTTGIGGGVCPEPRICISYNQSIRDCSNANAWKINFKLLNIASLGDCQ